jgi:hypothetical protein
MCIESRPTAVGKSRRVLSQLINGPHEGSLA